MTISLILTAAGVWIPLVHGSSPFLGEQVRAHDAIGEKSIWEDPVSFFLNPMFMLRSFGFVLVLSVLQSCWTDTRYKMLFPILGVMVQLIVAMLAPGVGEYLVDSAIFSCIILWLVAPSVPFLQQFIGVDGSLIDSSFAKKAIAEQGTEYAALMHYTASISNCAKSGDVARAEQLFSKMAERTVIAECTSFQFVIRRLWQGWQSRAR